MLVIIKFFIIIFFVIGLIMTLFGIWEQKTRYSDRQFATGKVVAHKAVKSHENIVVVAANATLDIVTPVVEFTNSSGCVKTAPLHLDISKMMFEKFPEFDIGGELTISFFGDSPRECFLENHPMSQTVIKTSACLIFGIALLAVSVLLTAYYISI